MAALLRARGFHALVNSTRSAELKLLQCIRCSTSSSAGAGNSAAHDLSTSNSRLFENIPPIPPEAGAASSPSAAAAAAAAGGTAAAAADSATAAAGPFSRIGTFISNVLFYGFLSSAALAGYYQYRYTAQQLDHMVDETEKPENAFPGSMVWIAGMRKYLEYRHWAEEHVRDISEPPSDKLLPDLPPQHKHVKTLVLDLDDVLIHASWTRQRGWRSFKRPGVEEFLRHMAQYYELVLYTDQTAQYADPIMDRIDPQKNVGYRLYRNATYYKEGKHIRDLSKLNRDLSRVLFISCKPHAYALQPNNTIKLSPWKLNADDSMLIDLIPFLEAIVRTNVPDVRDVVKSYDGLDIPSAFKERMQQVQQKQKQQHGPASFLNLRKAAA